MFQRDNLRVYKQPQNINRYTNLHGASMTRLTPVTLTWSPGEQDRVTSPRAITVIERGMLPTGTWSFCSTQCKTEEHNDSQNPRTLTLKTTTNFLKCLCHRVHNRLAITNALHINIMQLNIL